MYSKLCSQEGFLNRKQANNQAFRCDLHMSRLAISSGESTIKTEMHNLKVGELSGQLSPNVKVQLEGCLGRIAAGECPSYPIAIN